MRLMFVAAERNKKFGRNSAKEVKGAVAEERERDEYSSAEEQ